MSQSEKKYFETQETCISDKISDVLGIMVEFANVEKLNSILRRILFFLLLLSATPNLATQRSVRQRMNNIRDLTQGMSVFAIAQDIRGMMWFGTNEGLCSYDGYEKRAYGRSLLDAHGKKMKGLGKINCMTIQGNSILIGCERGIEVFRLAENKFSPYRLMKGHNVRFIHKDWVGTDKGLFIKGKRQGNLKQIYSMSQVNGKIYVGTDSCLYEYKGRRFIKIADMNYVSGVARVNSELLAVGTGPAMIVIDAQNNKTQQYLPIPVVKTILADGNRLLAGTDNGLYIYAQSTLSKVEHDAFRTSNSLAGNVVWSLFDDRDGNIWIGTDNGISMIENHPAVSWHYITDITGLHEGCRIERILIDKHQRTWLGGTSGLICVENLGRKDENYRWYKMGDTRYSLAHNHIRCIYEDHTGRILVGSDGGIMVYDNMSKQFRRHLIKEDAHNWIYDIYGEGNRLVVITADGAYLLNENTFRVLGHPKRIIRGERNMVLISGNTWHKDMNTGLLWKGGNDRFGLTTEPLVRKAYEPRKVYTIYHEPWGQNGITLKFSDFNYNEEKLALYQYRLIGLNKEWQTTLQGEHSIRYNYLKPGTYTFEVRPNDDENLISAYDFAIPRPWFASIPMLILYVMLFVVFIVAIILFFIQRKTIRLEREQREVLLETAKQKEKELQQELVKSSSSMLESMSKPSIDDNFLSTATHIIEERMEDLELSASTLAEACGIPQKQLYRKIKRLTGMTTVEYIRYRRMMQAAYLLSHGNFTISEVMYRVGFINASYFSRAFVAKHGMTPKEYKQIHKTDYVNISKSNIS